MSDEQIRSAILVVAAKEFPGCRIEVTVGDHVTLAVTVSTAFAVPKSDSLADSTREACLDIVRQIQ